MITANLEFVGIGLALAGPAVIENGGVGLARCKANGCGRAQVELATAGEM
ncbi:hypothetical protein C8E89_1432 [Mycolicibacterium moriokaense]|uniref:Uncharacterized protein n=1 Tax=Mycolicibacterium moriokaense TaxID=39691 RepID=A0A318H4V6_9MYCO|nr:hypothetical protein C8E89_1432 [Mycolicibacterium moriokaense]